ncbi:MAG: hypothetical protein E6Q97_33400 [Desulfurellales bacterium]|nr:MAG: hypothetical protein E6Q97_33400 [Desulfurellales bacterium]
MDENEMIAQRRAERSRLMVVRLAAYLNICNVDRFDQVPPHVAKCFLEMKYEEMIRPLVLNDRANGMAFRGLAAKYMIDHVTASRLCQPRPPKSVAPMKRFHPLPKD